MKKLTLILAGIVVSGLLTSCGNYTDIPSASAHNLDTALSDNTDISVPEDEPALADYYAYDITFPAYNANEATAESTVTIDMERALNAALNHENLTIDDVSCVEAELEHEPFGVFWEIEFIYNGYEYSFYIDAESGDVVRSYSQLND